MIKKPESVVCDRCRTPSLRIEVRRYFLYKKNGEVVTIENALIIKCPLCGEYPATGEEKKRWKAEKNRREAKEVDPNEPCCDICGKPRRMTGQFFQYGPIDGERKGYCRECNDTLGLNP